MKIYVIEIIYLYEEDSLYTDLKIAKTYEEAKGIADKYVESEMEDGGMFHDINVEPISLEFAENEHYTNSLTFGEKMVKCSVKRFEID